MSLQADGVASIASVFTDGSVFSRRSILLIAERLGYSPGEINRQQTVLT